MWGAHPYFWKHPYISVILSLKGSNQVHNFDMIAWAIFSSLRLESRCRGTSATWHQESCSAKNKGWSFFRLQEWASRCIISAKGSWNSKRTRWYLAIGIPSTMHAHAVVQIVAVGKRERGAVSLWSKLKHLWMTGYVNTVPFIKPKYFHDLPCRFELTSAGSSDRFEQKWGASAFATGCLLSTQWSTKCALSQHRATLAVHTNEFGPAMEHMACDKSLLVLLQVHSLVFPQNMQTCSGMVCEGVCWLHVTLSASL